MLLYIVTVMMILLPKGISPISPLCCPVVVLPAHRACHPAPLQRTGQLCRTVAPFLWPLLQATPCHPCNAAPQKVGPLAIFTHYVGFRHLQYSKMAFFSLKIGPHPGSKSHPNGMLCHSTEDVVTSNELTASIRKALRNEPIWFTWQLENASEKLWRGQSGGSPEGSQCSLVSHGSLSITPLAGPSTQPVKAQTAGTPRSHHRSPPNGPSPGVHCLCPGPTVQSHTACSNDLI